METVRCNQDWPFATCVQWGRRVAKELGIYAKKKIKSFCYYGLNDIIWYVKCEEGLMGGSGWHWIEITLWKRRGRETEDRSLARSLNHQHLWVSAGESDNKPWAEILQEGGELAKRLIAESDDEGSWVVSDYMTFRRGDFRKNGGKWTGVEKKRNYFTGYGRQSSLLNSALREASSSRADRI